VIRARDGGTLNSSDLVGLALGGWYPDLRDHSLITCNEIVRGEGILDWVRALTEGDTELDEEPLS
jgi:hypothetical protein